MPLTITSNDFLVDPTNKRISHVPSSSTIFPVNALYSYVQSYFGEVEQLTYSVAMSAQTPTEYTFTDGWFIDETSLKFVNGGAVKTIGWDAGTYSDGIYIIKLAASGYVSCVSSDVGQVVTAGGTSGVLLAYDNSLRKWWVRRNVGTTWSGAITIPSGSGAGTFLSVVTGESLFANAFTLGSLEPTTTNTIYVEQVNSELANNKISQFWSTGHIDILIKVKEASTLIDTGLVRFYCREYGNLFTHYLADMSSGGRNPIPLSSIADNNNTTAAGTVSTWSDVTITFGAITRDIGDGFLRPYNVEVDCGNRTSLSQVYEYLKYITDRTSTATLNSIPGYFYRKTNNAYLENSAAPFGSFAGGRLFGARGVWFKNVPTVDYNNYQVVDNNGVTSVTSYASNVTLVYSSNLLTGLTGTYHVYFSSTPQGNYGTVNAITVNDNIGAPLTGPITSNIFNFSFDYTNNNQGGRTPNIDAAIIIVVKNPGNARPTEIPGTITASKSVVISVTAADERAF